MNNADEINISIMTKEMVAKETGNVRAQSQTEDNFGNHVSLMMTISLKFKYSTQFFIIG